MKKEHKYKQYEYELVQLQALDGTCRRFLNSVLRFSIWKTLETSGQNKTITFGFFFWYWGGGRVMAVSRKTLSTFLNARSLLLHVRSRILHGVLSYVLTVTLFPVFPVWAESIDLIINTRSFILFSSFYAVPSSPVAILPMQVCGWGVRTLFLQLFFIFAFLRGALYIRERSPLVLFSGVSFPSVFYCSLSCDKWLDFGDDFTWDVKVSRTVAATI